MTDETTLRAQAVVLSAIIGREYIRHALVSQGGGGMVRSEDITLDWVREYREIWLTLDDASPPLDQNQRLGVVIDRRHDEYNPQDWVLLDWKPL